MLDNIDWKPLDKPENLQPGVLYATHSGVLKIAEGVELKCYQLDDGRRVLDADDVHEFLGGMANDDDL